MAAADAAAGLLSGTGRRVVVVGDVADPDAEIRVEPGAGGARRRGRRRPASVRPARSGLVRHPGDRRPAAWTNIAGMDAITFPPAPVNEPNLTYAPGSAERAALKVELDKLERRQHDASARTSTAGSAPVAAGRSRSSSRTTTSTCSASSRTRRRADAQAAVKAALDAAPEWRAMPFDERARGHPQGRRPAGRPVAAAAQRRHHARPVQDRVPGGDRRGLRADRLLAVQRPLRAADPRRAADREQPGHLEPHRPPPARGLRLRDHAVQLHRDRRQPADRAGADGQHRGLEAVADAAARRARSRWSCSRRPACRRA